VSHIDVHCFSILTKIGKLSTNFSNILDIKFQENRFNDPQLLQSGWQIDMAKLLSSFPHTCTDSSVQTRVLAHNSHFILRTESLLGSGNTTACTCTLRQRFSNFFQVGTGPLSLVRMFYGPPYSSDYQTH